MTTVLLKKKKRDMTLRTKRLFLDETQEGCGPNGALQKSDQGIEHPSTIIFIIHFVQIVFNVRATSKIRTFASTSPCLSKL